MTLYSYLITIAYMYITFSLTCGLRTVYLIHLKNLICVDIVKCQVKFCLLLDFLQIILFLTILTSAGGPHKSSGRAACGPPAAGWTALPRSILWPGPYYTQCNRPDYTPGRSIPGNIMAYANLY